MFDDETPVAWQAMPRHAPVVAADGTEIGTAESLLGDQEEDIFHGIVARRKGGGENVEIPARRITRITTRHVITDLGPSEAEALPPYRKG
jgi:PRC-barrel domain